MQSRERDRCHAGAVQPQQVVGAAARTALLGGLSVLMESVEKASRIDMSTCVCLRMQGPDAAC